MSSWGASTTDESKPKFLTDEEKRDVYATDQGWVKRTTGTGDRAGRVHEEILVAIGELSETLAEANISNVTLVTVAYDVLIFVVLTILDANAPTKMFLTNSASLTG